MKASILLRQAAHRTKTDPIGASELAQQAIDLLRDEYNKQMIRRAYIDCPMIKRQAQ